MPDTPATIAPRKHSRKVLAITSPNGAPGSIVERPRMGELTRRQLEGGQTSTQRIVQTYASQCEIMGLPAPPPGTYATYRMMRGNPTIAIARMAATAAVKGVAYSFEEEDAPPGALALIESVLNEDVLRLLIREMLRALDYGNQPFEIVWELLPFEGSNRLAPRKIKPLLPDHTQVVIEKEHGGFIGLKNRNIELSATESLLFVYDGEAGDWYGRSRNENIREHIWPKWVDLNKRMRQYAKKVTGVIPMVRYPQGEAVDGNGTTQSTYAIAKGVIDTLSSGQGIAFPAELSSFAEEMIRAGVSGEDLWSWSIQFLEMKTSHGNDLIGMQKSVDSELVRGWLLPERAILEGQYGTKAEAETHVDFVLQDSEDTAKDIALALNWHLIDKVLALNWGEAARGTVRVTPAPIVDEKARAVKAAVASLLQNPLSLESIANIIDLDQMVEQSGLPKKEAGAPNQIIVPPQPGATPQPGSTAPAPLAGGTQQSESILKIVVAVNAGELPRDSGVSMLQSFFGMTEQQAEEIMGSAGTKGATKATAADDDNSDDRMRLTRQVAAIVNGSGRRFKMLAEVN